MESTTHESRPTVPGRARSFSLRTARVLALGLLVAGWLPASTTAAAPVSVDEDMLARLGDGRDADPLRHVHLDVLVASGSRVEPSVLRHARATEFPGAFLPAVTILMSREAAAFEGDLEALLDRADLPVGVDVLAGAALARTRPKRAARQLLARVEASVELRIAEGSSIPSGRTSSGPTDATTESPSGDAVPRYEIVFDPRRADARPLMGDRPAGEPYIGYRRVDGPSRGELAVEPDRRRRAQRTRIELLASLVKRPAADFAPLFAPPRSLQAAELVGAARASRRTVEESWWALAAALRDADLLTLDDFVALGKTPEVLVHDDRTDPSEPLPEIPDLLPRVRIGDLMWYVRYDDGLRAAREQGLPMFVHFGENPG